MTSTMRVALLCMSCGILVHAPPAMAETPCDGATVDSGVPLRLAFGPAGLGMVPEACPATEVAVQGGGALLIATEDFYGSVAVSGAVRGRVDLSGGRWLSLWAPGLDYRFVANATIEADALDLGAGSVGFHQQLRVSDRIAIAPFVRLLIPTETVYEHATRLGVDQGLAAIVRISPSLEVDGGLSFPLLTVVNLPRVAAVLVPTAVADVAWSPWAFLTTVAGLGMRLRSGNGAGFESLDPRLGLRLFPTRGARVELGAAMPLFGRDRTDAVATLSLGTVL